MNLDRRDVLGLLGGGLVAAVVGACGGGGGKKRPAAPTTSPTTVTGSAPASGAGAPATCMLAPEVTEGPFWLTDHPQASDLVQDRPGVPLELVLTVVDQSCRPISDAKVDIWHCDASGEYAGVGGGPGGPGGPGGAARRTSPANWLQGYQAAGSDGIVRFRTI